MRLVLSTTLLGLAWFAAVNLAVSAVAWCAGRAVLARAGMLPASALLALRLLPATAALAVAWLVFAPAHIRFEPADPDERFGVTIFALAACGAWLLGRSAWRLTRVAAAARMARRWSVTRLAASPVQAYEIGGYSGVSLAGVFRPRILVGAGARESLTADELDVAIAHERAHRSALDNLKRCAIFCAPDCFGGTRTAAALEAQWRARAEHDADTRAVGSDERRAVHLASALLKVARAGREADRLTPSLLWSAFNDPALLEARVRSLLTRPADAAPRWRGPARAVLTAAAVLALAGWLAHAPHDVHGLTEAFVALLP